MKYQRYPTYKDSGVEWLGEVPSHWEVIKLKRIASLKSGEAIPAEQIHETGLYPVYGGNNIRGYSNIGFTHEGRLPLIGRQGALCGNINYSSGKFWASEHAVVVTPLADVTVSWLGELLRSMNLNQYSVSAAQPGLSVETIGNLFIPLPPTLDQAAIASFLDRETAQIDALIARQERLIAVLQEKRQALTSHAVTKGLNPAAPMKDSGVEWLGEVPAHWDTIPMRRLLFTIEQGQTLNSENRSAEVDEWGVLKSGCVNGGTFRVEEHKALASGTTFDLHNEVKAGDILMSRASGSIELVGSVALVDDVRWGLLLSDKTFRLVPSSAILPEFLVAQLNARHVRTQIKLLANGAEGLPNNITKPSINSLFVALPPLEEQRAVVEYLADGTAKLDCVAVQAQKMVNVLQERRIALISAAVTGKIDVRNHIN